MSLIFSINSSMTLIGIANDDEDFWEDIFARPSVKYGVTIFTLMSMTCLIPFYSINIKYIQNKHYKTVVSYGEQMLCFCGILIMVLVYSLSLLRLLLGPLSATLCWLQIFFNQTCSVTGMLVLNAYYLARYFYGVVYKTTTICNEELIGFYIFIFTLLIGCILAFVHNMSPGKWALNYYICLGENPDKYQISGGKFPVTAFVSMVTIIVYALTNYRFFKAKKKNNRILALAAPLVQSNDHEEQLQISQENFLAQCFPVAKGNFWSMLDLVTLYIVVIMFVTESIQWNFFQKKLSVMEMKTTPAGHFYYIHHQYINAQLCLWLVAFNSLARNADLRKYILQTFYSD